MKNLFLTIFMGSLICLSCDFQSQKSDTHSPDNKKEPVAIQEPDKSEEPPVFTSPDLQWAWAHGHVKSITETQKIGSSASQKIIYRFDKQGKLTYLYKEESGRASKITRDNNGRIKMTEEGDDYPDTESITYYYNTDGYVIKTEGEWFQGGDESFYQLNQQGWLTEESNESRGFYGPLNYSITYKYTYQYNTTDKMGNWTSCTKSAVLTSYDTNDTSFEPDNRQYKVTITRKIEYYENQ